MYMSYLNDIVRVGVIVLSTNISYQLLRVIHIRMQSGPECRPRSDHVVRSKEPVEGSGESFLFIFISIAEVFVSPGNRRVG